MWSALKWNLKATKAKVVDVVSSAKISYSVSLLQPPSMPMCCGGGGGRCGGKKIRFRAGFKFHVLLSLTQKLRKYISLNRVT
jgi:hypothetical protein